MKWKTCPTKSGCYWRRPLDQFDEAILVWCERSEGKWVLIFFEGDPEEVYDHENDELEKYRWYGPLTPDWMAEIEGRIESGDIVD